MQFQLGIYSKSSWLTQIFSLAEMRQSDAFWDMQAPGVGSYRFVMN